MNSAPVRQDVHVTRAASTMLHPILQLRLRASTLRAVILVLAAHIFLAKLARATCEDGEAEKAIVHLVGDGQEAWVVHMRVLHGHRIQVASHELLLCWIRHPECS